MRTLSLLLLLAGLGIGIGYPFAVSNFSGHEIGTYPAFDRQSGYRTVDAALSPDDAPVRVLVDMTSMGAITLDGSTTLLTLTASVEGRTVLARTLTFAHQQPRSDNPQAGGMVYRDDAGLIDPVEAGTYRFTLGPGDGERIQMRSVQIVLRAGAVEADRRALPIGYGLMGLGFVGLLMSLRRRKRAPPAGPPSPKWGR